MSGQKKVMTDLERVLGFTLTDLELEVDKTEAAELAQAALQLQRFTAPEPTKASAQRLLQAVRRYVPENAPPRFRQTMQQAGVPKAGFSLSLLTLIRPQISLLGRPFWAATVLLLLLATWLVLLPNNTGQLPLLMFAPLTGALGIVYAFRSTDERVLELEAASAMTWQQLVLARMILIIGMNVAVLSAVTLISALLLPGFPIGLLMLSWLAPLLLWASIALNVSLRFGHWAGMVTSFAAWGLQIIVRLTLPQWDLFSLPGSIGEIALRLALVILALATLALAVRSADNQRDLVSHHLNRS